jgi:putative PIN family toxin of toxin-antitoxin system
LSVRVVFDTNIFISAFAIPGGRAEEAYLHAVRGDVELFTSVAILTETANVLHTKFEWSDVRIQRLIRIIGKSATVLRPEVHLQVLADDADNRVLECAVVAHADVLVTGDRHLLALNRYEGTDIVKLPGFLHSLE